MVLFTLYPTALTVPVGPRESLLELKATFPLMKVRRCAVLPGVHLRRTSWGGPVDFRFILMTLFTDLPVRCRLL